jgi:hypothetical protein
MKMAEEQGTPAVKEKLPIKTKVAAWVLLVIATIHVFIALVFFILMAGSSNEDFSMYAPMPLFIGFGIALFYFLPGILLLKTRSTGPWILSVIILFAGILIPFGISLRNLFDFIHFDLPPQYLGGPYEAVFVGYAISFLIPLLLVLWDKISHKVVISIPVVLTIVALVCYFGVFAVTGHRHDLVVDFDSRMYVELQDLYGQAIEDGATKGCQGCEEVSQYFYEQWNQADPYVRNESWYDNSNNNGYRACFKAVAVITENISVCDCLETIDSGGYEECRRLVQALVADDISLCFGEYECASVFAIMTDNPSLCDNLLWYEIDDCHNRYNESQEDPDDYLGVFWTPSSHY